MVDKCSSHSKIKVFEPLDMKLVFCCLPMPHGTHRVSNARGFPGGGMLAPGIDSPFKPPYIFIKC